VRPADGEGDPDVTRLLAITSAAMSAEVLWLNGTLPIRVSAYRQAADLPEHAVTSVRCIVLVDNRIVLCDSPDGCHPWPGRRREPGETYVETACREVHEETGLVS
jgi:hypothetical protein